MRVSAWGPLFALVTAFGGLYIQYSGARARVISYQQQWNWSTTVVQHASSATHSFRN